MKKIITISFTFTTVAANAQSEYGALSTKYYVEKFAALFSVFLIVFIVASFIIVFTRLILDAWLRNKLLEKGLSEEFLKQFMQGRKIIRQEALKWCLIFTGLGVGLFLISILGTLLLTSLAILSSCLGISFFFYLRLLKNLT